MTTLTADQQKLQENIKYPKNWDNPNPPIHPAPFNYNNSYTSPVWTSGLNSSDSQQGSGNPQIGGPYNYSNQFTSALTQKANPMHNTPQAGRGVNNPPPLDMVNPFSKDKPVSVSRQPKKKLIKYSN